MTYNLPLWAVEGEGFTEVANFKDEGLEEKKKNVFWKLICPWGELNPALLRCLHEKQECWPQHYLDVTLWSNKMFSIWTLLLDGLDCNKVSYKVKAAIHYPRLRWSIFVIKANL